MSSVRNRTVGHMHKLIAATAAASACSRPDVQTVTITPLPTVPVSTDTTAPPPQPTASATLTQPPQPPPPPDPSGYLVVDMLPAPARCLGVASASKVTAKFHRDAGRVVLDLVIALPTSGAASGTKFIGSGATSAWSANIVSSSFRSSNTVANVRLQPTSSTAVLASMGAQLQVSCGSRGNGTLGISVTYNSPPTESTVPNVTLNDY
ncbi:MAG TPA: hypothetical protein VGH87_15600 [Polyangiaceae bacterium]